MATLYTEQSKNVTKTWLLMSVFLVVVIGFGWFFSFYYSNPNILYFFVAFSILMNFFSYYFSDKIVLTLAGAKEAKRDENFVLYTTVENLSITAGLPMPKIYIVTDAAPNAFATGRNKEHAVVAVTTGLLAILEKPELEGVIAHELSHVGNKDMLLSTVVVVLVGFVTIVADVFRRNLFFSRGRDDNDKGGIFMIIGIILSILAPLFAVLIQLAISRKREFLADASGALLTRYPDGLANALRKISLQNQPMTRQSSAIAHLYIADPKGSKISKIGQKVTSIFATHPPVEERIKALVG
ncbi:MAG: M48 family metallopeptidase [Candidatus Paceibacterota bacterium]|jgi:heat shock protein HtpX